VRQTGRVTAQLVSGEAVPLELDRAGVGSRSVAAIIDLAAQYAAMIGVTIADEFLARGDDAIFAALAIVEFVLIFGAYPIVFEWLSRGRTLGKLALGLRVVRDDGGPIGFRQALVRGLAGLLLEKPGLLAPFGTAVGAGLLAFTASNKRIGDFMAGTFVVRERAGSATAMAAQHYFVPYELQAWAMSLDLTRVDDTLALGLRQFVQRAGGMSPHAREGLEAQFHARLLALVAPPPPPGVPASVLLMTVLAERRRRADLAANAQHSVPGFGTQAGSPVPPSSGAPGGWPTAPPTGGQVAPQQNSDLDAGNPFARPS
jgi:uncharacterized RDD family membrane protein YckC